MADNTQLNTGTGGDIIATDDIGGVKYPIGKVAFGPLDTATLVTAAVGLPVGDAGGSLTVDSPQLPAALGQAVSASSLPVVLPATQITTLTPPAAITGFATEATLDARTGSLTETAPATDTASSGLNGRLQRIAQRLTSLIALLPTSLGQKAKASALAVTLASDEDLLSRLPSALVTSALSVTEKAPWGWGYTRPYSDALPQEVISSGGVTNSIAVLGGTSPVLQDVRGFNKIVIAVTVNYRSGAAITGFTIRLLARSRLQNGTVPPDIGLATTNAVDTALQGYGSKDLTITFGTSFSSGGRTFYIDALSLLGIPLAGDIDFLCGTVGGNADVYINAMFGSS